MMTQSSIAVPKAGMTGALSAQMTVVDPVRRLVCVAGVVVDFADDVDLVDVVLPAIGEGGVVQGARLFVGALAGLAIWFIAGIEVGGARRHAVLLVADAASLIRLEAGRPDIVSITAMD